MARNQPKPTETAPPPDVVGVPGRVQLAPLVDLGGGPAIPSPPGTKCKGHLTHWPGDEPVSPWPSRLALAGTALGFLTAGILIGRFLLP
jgi:hypothetical protein